jgi:chromosomal replication initiator protein
MSVSSRQQGNDQVWSDFLASVATLVNKQTFETWFKPMRLTSIDGCKVSIDCPSKFFVDWVSEHHSDKIAFALRRVIGGEPQVFLNNANDAPPEISRRSSVVVPAPLPRPRRGTSESERLNPKYVFDEFVVGSNSRMTYAACLAVSERPAQVYNPLFIYGGVGLGKTHLMQAIGHGVLKSHPNARVHYCSAEVFMNEMIGAIRQGNGHDFRTKYRNVDLLLIDDIQFLAGKESTQEEFFHTFNALHGANRQIVVTSDCPPKEIPKLEDRLVSRFEWGLITDIQPPDYETRLAILRKKVERENICIPDDVLALIAESVKSNIRELEGSLVKLLVHASVYKKDVTVEMAHDVLKDFASLAQIGQRFGGRDHTTVIHACQKISDLIERDVSLRSTVNQLRKELSF